MDMHEKVVLITGGGRGIGAALAKSFAEAGARVAVVSRTKEEVQAVASAIDGFALVGDVQHEIECRRIADETYKHFGAIDILINNAGVAYMKPLTEHSETEYDTIMDTNVKGVFLMTRAVMAHHPKMIVTISSGAGKSGLPGLSVYCASKFAVHGLMESFSQETHAKVYTVFPGSTDTHMYHELYEAKARVQPEQVANAIVALCQQEPPTGFELELYNIL
jgi:NAD(P)-dependent dehydrogenase (short-subunit alcohol dehydrogenase family)